MQSKPAAGPSGTAPCAICVLQIILWQAFLCNYSTSYDDCQVCMVGLQLNLQILTCLHKRRIGAHNYAHGADRNLVARG
jgi:hypothetical protein